MRCLKEKFNLLLMIIDLFDLEGASGEFDVSLAASGIELESENFKLKNDVKIHGKVAKKPVQTDVAGKIFAEAEIECARCLQPVEKKLEIPFSVVYVTAENYTEAKESELSGEDLDVSVFEGNIIDLSDLVREQVILDLSEKVSCSEECKGLCPKCGANQNLIDCNCEETEIDPRWAALKNLK